MSYIFLTANDGKLHCLTSTFRLIHIYPSSLRHSFYSPVFDLCQHAHIRMQFVILQLYKWHFYVQTIPLFVGSLRLVDMSTKTKIRVV